MSTGTGVIILLLGLVLIAIPIGYVIEPSLHGSGAEQMVQIFGFTFLTLPFTLPLLIVIIDFAMEALK